MGIIYGFGRIALLSSSLELTEVCTGDFKFEYVPEFFRYKYFNSARQLYLPADKVLLTSREYFITVTASAYNYKLLKQIFGTTVTEAVTSVFVQPPIVTTTENLVFEADCNLQFTGLAYTVEDKKIVFSAEKIVPIEISDIGVAQGLTIKFRLAGNPTIIVEEEDQDLNRIVQTDLFNILLADGGKLLWN